jgi:hypothetical protein
MKRDIKAALIKIKLGDTVLCFDRVLTKEERDLIRAALMRFWGIK